MGDEMDLIDKVAAALMSAQAHGLNLGGQANAAIAVMDEEIKRLRGIIADAHDELCAEKGEYHSNSELGRAMAALR